MRWTMWIVAIAAAMSAPWLAAAQDRPAPTPEAPRAAEPAPAARPATPTDASEIREIEIIETPDVRPTQDAPAPPDAAEPPIGRREVRIVDGDTTIWVDEEGHMRELGDVMGQALEYNPELRAIRAEIQALMARLEQLEMKTATDVARKKVELKRLVDKQGELKKMKLDSPEVLALDADIAAKKVELDYIVGVRGDRRPPEDRFRVLGDIPVLANLGIQTSRPEISSIENKQLKEILDSPFDIFCEKKPLHEVIEMVTQAYQINFNLDVPVRDMPIDMNLSKPVPVRAALEALSDANRDLVFIVREYGIFATTRDRALGIPGPSIPASVPYSPRAGATPRPAPPAAWRNERVFKDGEHVFEGAHVERRRQDDEQADGILEYDEGKKAPAPTPKPAPNR